MSIFKRLFTIAESEANSLVDNLENPIKGTEQGIRELKVDLDNSIKALAEVKALSIKSKREAEQDKNNASDYEKKAMALLAKAQSGVLNSDEADNLASSAIKQRNKKQTEFNQEMVNYAKLENDVQKLENQVNDLKRTITKWENELKMLRARTKVNSSQKKLNKQLTQIDSSGTISMLERMKEKVAQDEALADAYGDIADIDIEVEHKIKQALDSKEQDVNKDLELLKKKLNK
ncbi:MAG: PspA/IM30 family protein [Bacteroidales bacterium]|nr:PspA/IM30 family protein [Bacteroidales bacterium]